MHMRTRDELSAPSPNGLQLAAGLVMLNAVAETSYAPCGDLSLAYQLFGDGPVELVFTGPFVSHIELFWTVPEFKAFFDQLATFCRIVVFDKAGVGLSDPVPRVRTLDDRATEIEAVMDAAGFSSAVLFGSSDGGPAAMMFAATRPDRTRALILCGTYSFYAGGWDTMDIDPVELRERFLPELGEDYMPTVDQIARLQAIGRAVRSEWGSGATFSISFPAASGRLRQLAMFERMCASPGMARAALGSVLSARRAADPADDHRPHAGHPCSRGSRRSGAIRPLSRRPHPGRAVPRGRGDGPPALVHRARHRP